MLELLIAALALAVLASIVRPLLRGAEAPPDSGAFDRAVYRDQLAEIDRDIARGVLSDAEAAAARLEVQRRLLAVPDAAPGRRAGASRGVALAVAALAALGSIGMYAALSVPQRSGAEAENRRGQAEALADRLRERLRAAPNDPEGWVLLARTLSALGDWGDAADAYRRAIAAGAASPDIQAALAEVLVARADGAVPPEARDLLRAALAAEPGHALARYYLALASAQDGDARGALTALAALAGDLPADAGPRAEIERQAARIAREAGIDPPSLPPGRAPEAGPDAETMEAAAALPPDQRRAMVEAMVARLAARLETSPGDIDGWMRLGRARSVLGQPEAAADAYERAAALRPWDVSVPLRAVEALLAGLKPVDPIPERAAAILRRVEAIRPDEPAALWYLGLVAARDGRRDAARDYWRRLQAGMDPRDPDADLVKQALEALGR